MKNWKAVQVDTDLLQTKEFEDFGGIDELEDYKIIKAGDDKKNKRKDKDGSKVTKKKKVPRLKNQMTKDGETSEEIDMSAWCNCFVPELVLKALQDLKFQSPTEIQKLAIPPAIRDRLDILGAAETGSGKTLAFGIPIISSILSLKDNKKNVEDSKPLYSLILSPTRELAIQITAHLQDICKYIDVKIATIFGGMASEKQKRILKKCPEIVVATPGRLWELIEEGEPHLNKLPFVKHLVIDEADRMLEKGHFTELSQILNFINSNKSSKRQNFVFSATLTFVHETPKRLILKKNVQKIQQKAKLESLINIIEMRQPKVIDITKKTALVDTLSESVIMCSREDKDLYLYYFLTVHSARTVVFCNSIDCVRRLRSILEYLNISILPLHAQMHQKQRLKNLERFASSSTAVLLATDVAARGLDIKGIENVIHYQVPRVVETYIHRSGRTARAKNEGLSLMLIEPHEGVFYKRINKTLNKGKALKTFPVDGKVFKLLREQITLARAIDKIEHKIKRLSAQNRWYEKASVQMDIDMEENLLNDLGDARKKEVTFLKKILNKKLMHHKMIGFEKAISLFKSSQKKRKKICT